MRSKRDKASRKAQDPFPVIAPRQEQPTKSSSNPSLECNVAGTAATARLPPRSRYGCWTCRNRKVKCDEARPKCTPCTRLGHTCDYSPRLSFKDDTPRVLEKMRPYTHPSSWSLPKRKYGNHEPVEDLLPPFSMLTCDEDRERKAEHKVPGTYHIIVNPASFGSLEQYADSQDGTGSSPGAISRHTDWRSPASTPNLRQDIFEGPDTLILGNFDENGCNSSSPSLASHSSSTNCIHSAQPCRRSTEMSPLLDTVWEDGEEHHIRLFYKTFVRNQLNQVHRDSLGTSAHSRTPTIPEVLEEQAPNYIPVGSAFTVHILESTNSGWRHGLFPNSHKYIWDSQILSQATPSAVTMSTSDVHGLH